MFYSTASYALRTSCLLRSCFASITAVACRTTLAAVILDYVGLYCEDSWSPGWGHIYVRTRLPTMKSPRSNISIYRLRSSSLFPCRCPCTASSSCTLPSPLFSLPRNHSSKWSLSRQSVRPLSDQYHHYPSNDAPTSVFLTFWQATMLSVLATFGLVKDVSPLSSTVTHTTLKASMQTQYMTAENINIGIGAIMETVEMTYVQTHSIANHLPI